MHHFVRLPCCRRKVTPRVWGLGTSTKSLAFSEDRESSRMGKNIAVVKISHVGFHCRFARIAVCVRQRETVSTESPSPSTCNNLTKNLGQRLQGRIHKERIIEFGAIARLLVGHWQQARRKRFVQLDRQRGHVSNHLCELLLGSATGQWNAWPQAYRN